MSDQRPDVKALIAEHDSYSKRKLRDLQEHEEMKSFDFPIIRSSFIDHFLIKPSEELFHMLEDDMMKKLKTQRDKNLK
jgi:hypothetical protein